MHQPGCCTGGADPVFAWQNRFPFRRYLQLQPLQLLCNCLGAKNSLSTAKLGLGGDVWCSPRAQSPVAICYSLRCYKSLSAPTSAWGSTSQAGGGLLKMICYGVAVYGRSLHAASPVAHIP